MINVPTETDARIWTVKDVAKPNPTTANLYTDWEKHRLNGANGG
jgi:hypothetical protein